MTVDHIKEELSARCIEAMANRQGFSTECIRKDYGIDLRIIEIIQRSEPDGKTAYLPSNREIKVQLKATTDKQIRTTNGIISYDLKRKNYNDMVYHLNKILPIYLFLIVMPDDETKWLEHTPDELILRSKCYWYIHPNGTPETNNDNTNVVYIPSSQIIEMTTFTKILEQIYN